MFLLNCKCLYIHVCRATDVLKGPASMLHETHIYSIALKAFHEALSHYRENKHFRSNYTILLISTYFECHINVKLRFLCFKILKLLSGTNYPTNLACSAVNSSTLQVTWDQATDTSVAGYHVEIVRVDGLKVEFGLPVSRMLVAFTLR